MQKVVLNFVLKERQGGYHSTHCGRPTPGVHKGRHLRGECRMSRDHTFGPTGLDTFRASLDLSFEQTHCPTGVQHHRSPFAIDWSELC